MTPEQMQKIIDGAPEWAKYWDKKMEFYTKSKYRGSINLDDLRTELAKREPMDLRDVDIPHGTIVLEK